MCIRDSSSTAFRISAVLACMMESGMPKAFDAAWQYVRSVARKSLAITATLSGFLSFRIHASIVLSRPPESAMVFAVQRLQALATRSHSVLQMSSNT